MKKLFILGFFLGIAAVLGAQDAKFALVIGNGDYANFGKLNNPVNDAQDLAQALKRLGFTVETLVNGDLAQMEEAVVRLGGRLAGNPRAVGFFFYAGHGVQSSGINYLIPTKAQIPSEAFLKTKALAAQAVLDTLQASGNYLNVVVLDACRDNPFSWARSGNRGLSVVGTQPPGSIIAYATSAGSVASDGSGRNGLFTQELLKHLETPGLDVSLVLKRTGQGVKDASQGKQVPAVYNQFFEDAVLGGKAAAGPTAASSNPGSGPQFGTLTPGHVTVSLATAGTLDFLGRKTEIPAGGQLPIKDVAPGDYTLKVTYKDGKTETQTLSVASGKTQTAVFTYKPAPAQAPQNNQTKPGKDSLDLILQDGARYLQDLAVKMEKNTSARGFKTLLEDFVDWEETYADRVYDLEDALDEKNQDLFTLLGQPRYQTPAAQLAQTYQRMLAAYQKNHGKFGQDPSLREILQDAMEADAELGTLFQP